ncbi:MAG: hypothetical protein WCD13_08540, partial [Pseudolabrys sp.]
ERSLPVIVLKHVGNVGEEYRAHRLLQVDNLSLLAEVGQWTRAGKDARGINIHNSDIERGENPG